MSEKQKEKILEYIERKFLAKDYGQPLITMEDLNRYAEEYDWMDENHEIVDRYYQEEYEAIRTAIEKGLTVYCGCIEHEDSDYQLCNIYEDIWGIMEESNNSNFILIDGDLSY